VDPTTTTLLGQLASQGILGTMLVIVMYVAWRKDQALQDEHDARITDAKAYTDMALKLQAQVLDSVNKLSEVLDEMRKLMVPQNRSTFGGGR